MANNSKIEWTESTWNPVTGCTKVSPGCKNCYAERLSKRLKAIGQSNYQNGFRLTLHPHILKSPLSWIKPRVIFVNSMSDLFHEKIPLEFIQKVFDIMNQAHQHTFQVLTKRAERLEALNCQLPWADNIWIGVSVESRDYLYRISHLRKINAKIRFLSFEPLLGPIDNLNLNGIDWVIVGGESGPRSRIMRKEWVLQIRDQCLAQKVPFFFKQWGGINKKAAGRLLENRIWDELPAKIF